MPSIRHYFLWPLHFPPGPELYGFLLFPQPQRRLQHGTLNALKLKAVNRILDYKHVTLSRNGRFLRGKERSEGDDLSRHIPH